MNVEKLYDILKNDLYFFREILDYDEDLSIEKCTFIDLGLECTCDDGHIECIESITVEEEEEFVESYYDGQCKNCKKRPFQDPQLKLTLSCLEGTFVYLISETGQVRPQECSRESKESRATKASKAHMYSEKLEQWVHKKLSYSL